VEQHNELLQEIQDQKPKVNASGNACFCSFLFLLFIFGLALMKCGTYRFAYFVLECSTQQEISGAWCSMLVLLPVAPHPHILESVMTSAWGV